MDGILNRIKEIITNEGISPSELADTIGIGRPLLSHVLSGRNNPSLQFVLKILEHYPAYSANWLLTGKEVLVADAPSLPKSESTLFEVPVNKPDLPSHPPIKKTETMQPDGLPEVVLMMFDDKTYEAYKLRK